MNEFDLSISNSDSDDDSNYEQPDVYAQQPSFGASINETADSMKDKMDIDQKQFKKVQPLISDFYHKQLVKKNYDIAKLAESKIFQKYDYDIFPPNPSLYFLPTTILIKSEANLFQIRDQIVALYGNQHYINHKPNKKTGDKLQVIIHKKDSMSFYVIKIISTKLNYDYSYKHCFDHSLVLNQLFQYYVKNYDKITKISQMTGLLLYWAYQKGILDEEYLSEDAIKLMAICFFIGLGIGITNVISTFQKENKSTMQKMKKMYKVNKRMEVNFQAELFEQEFCFAIKEQKGFYVPRLKKYTTIKEIIPIPYPITEQDFKRHKDKKMESQFERHKFTTNNPVYLFFRFLHYLNGLIMKSKNLKIDFVQKKFGYSSSNSETGFSLEVMHPVFETNLCQPLSQDVTKMRKVKFEIEKAVQISKDKGNPIEALKQVLAKK